MSPFRLRSSYNRSLPLVTGVGMILLSSVGLTVIPRTAAAQQFFQTVNASPGNGGQSQSTADPQSPDVSASFSYSDSPPGANISASAVSQTTGIGAFSGSAYASYTSTQSATGHWESQSGGRYYDAWELLYTGSDPNPGAVQVYLGQSVTSSVSANTTESAGYFQGTLDVWNSQANYTTQLLQGANGYPNYNNGPIVLTLAPGDRYTIQYDWDAVAWAQNSDYINYSEPKSVTTSYSGFVGYIAPPGYGLYSVGGPAGISQPLPLSTLTPTTPEPGTWALLAGLGVSGTFAFRRRRRNRLKDAERRMVPISRSLFRTLGHFQSRFESCPRLPRPAGIGMTLLWSLGLVMSTRVSRAQQFQQTVLAEPGSGGQQQVSSDPSAPNLYASATYTAPSGYQTGSAVSQTTGIGVFSGAASSAVTLLEGTDASASGTYNDTWELLYTGSDPAPGAVQVSLGQQVSSSFSTNDSTSGGTLDADLLLYDRYHSYSTQLLQGDNGAPVGDNGPIVLTLTPGDTLGVQYQWNGQAAARNNGASPTGSDSVTMSFSGFVGYNAPAGYGIYSVGGPSGISAPQPIRTLAAVTPEPGSWVLFGSLSLTGLGFLRRRIGRNRRKDAERRVIPVFHSLFRTLSRRALPLPTGIAMPLSAVALILIPQISRAQFSQSVTANAGGYASDSKSTADPLSPNLSASTSYADPSGNFAYSVSSQTTGIVAFNGNVSATDSNPGSSNRGIADTASGNYTDTWELLYHGSNPTPGPVQVSLGQAVSSSFAVNTSESQGYFQGTLTINDPHTGQHTTHLTNGSRSGLSDQGAILLTLSPGDTLSAAYTWESGADAEWFGAGYPQNTKTASASFDGFVGYIAPEGYGIYSIGGSAGPSQGFALSTLTAATPEPGTWALLIGLGVSGVFAARSRRVCLRRDRRAEFVRGNRFHP